MRFLSLVVLLPVALCKKLVIPEVEQAIAQEKALFREHIAYTDGPTGTAKAIASKATPKVLAQLLNQQAKSAVAAAAGTPYWYEQITHQGISAFNSDSTYKVYRNVKDYGAKGFVDNADCTDQINALLVMAPPMTRPLFRKR